MLQQYTPQNDRKENSGANKNLSDPFMDMTKATQIKEQSDSKSLHNEYDLKELEFYKQKEEAFYQVNTNENIYSQQIQKRIQDIKNLDSQQYNY